MLVIAEGFQVSHSNKGQASSDDFHGLRTDTY
jgi:hypothetical protein